MEAEYCSLVDTASEVNWIEFILQELGVTVSLPLTIKCDNVAANFHNKNPIHHSRTKHVAIHYHFVREQVEAGQLQAEFVCSKEQLADILTKSLARPQFKYSRDKLMVEAPHLLEGGVSTTKLDGYKSVIKVVVIQFVILSNVCINV